MENDLDNMVNFAMDCRNTMLKRNFNPIEAMIDIAIDEEDPELRFKASKELAGYYAPKMGSVRTQEENKEASRSLFLQINNYKAEALSPSDAIKQIHKVNQLNNAPKESST